MTSTGRTINSVEKSCEILQYLRQNNGGRITEIAEDLEMSKGNVHHHLNTLRKHEFVTLDQDEYDISLKFVDYGEHAKRSVEQYDVVREEITQLADRVGEVINFAVEQHGRVIYLHKERAEGGVRTAAYPGTRLHMHCSALGKAILAHYSQDRISEIIKRHGLPAYTENTITDEDQFRSELQKTHETGVGYDYQEALEGVRCVAVPLRDQTGNVFGAISVSGPSRRFVEERFTEEIPEQLSQSANVIEVNLSTQE